MSSSSSAEADLRARVRRQETVAELSQQALHGDDVDQLLADAATSVAETLDVDRAAPLELLPDRAAALLVTDAGWQADDVGSGLLPAGAGSHVGTALAAEEPVCSEDLAPPHRPGEGGPGADEAERDGDRNADSGAGSEEFDDAGSDPEEDVERSEDEEGEARGHPLQDVESGVAARIGSGDDPWGVLGVYASEQRSFTDREVAFVTDVADVLETAVERRRGLHELATEGALVEHIADASPIGIAVVGADGQFEYANDRAAEILGRDRETIRSLSTQSPDWDVVGDDGEPLPASERPVQTTLETGDAVYDRVLGVRRPDGERVWLSTSATPLRTDGSLRGAVLAFQDVTGDRRRERELEARSAAMEQSVDGIAILNEDGEYVFANQAHADTYGYDDPEAFVGETWRFCYHEDEIERLEAEALTALREDGEWRSEGLGRCADGSAFPQELSLTALEDGRMICVVRDVSDRERTERELEESERRYRTLAEHFPNGIVTLFDEDLEYTLAAGQAFEDIPVEPEAVEGSHVSDVWNEETSATLEAAFEAALDGEEQSIDLEYVGRDWVVRVVPIYDESGDVFAGATMAQDITDRKDYERYLEDAKSQLEAATEAGAVGTWEWDVEGDEMAVGETFAKTFGVDPEVAREGVSSDRFLAAIHDADRERVEAKIEDAMDRCGEYEAEYRVENAEGEFRWVVARGRVEADEDGEPATFTGALTDITERKRAELELERNTEQLETIFDILPVGVVVAGADGRMIQANDTAREIWDGDVFDADSIEEYEQYPVSWAETGERVEPEEMTLARVLDGEEVLEPDVVEVEAADGERRIVEAEGTPIRDEDGEVTRAVVTLVDVTEQREYQRRIEESERRYRTLAEHFPNGAVGVFDRDLRYTLAEGQMLGEHLPPGERLEGDRMPDIFPDDVTADLEPIFRSAVEDGETGSAETQFGGRHWRVWTTPLRDADGEIFAGLSFAQDVTEQLEREERLADLVRKLEASNERLEQFAYAASHDLQEPLRMVSSYLTLIERRYADQLDQDGREFMEYAVDGADRMRDMIEALLEYSRVETRGDPFEPVDLQAVFEDVRRDLEVRIEESDAELTVDRLPTVEGDAGQLAQVFQNLLKNAIDYSGDESPRIHVTAERASEVGETGESDSVPAEGDGDVPAEGGGVPTDGVSLPADGASGVATGPTDPRRADDWWVISVRDEGIGVDPDQTDRIFQVFQRLHSHEEQPGTGIGLALCRRIVERHGGDIWVDSAPGEGSTFSFTLPEIGESNE